MTGPAKGPWLGASAAALAYLGTVLLPGEAFRAWGVLILLASGILAVVAWGEQRPLPAFTADRATAPRSRPGLLPGSAVILSVLLDWQAGVQFLEHPDKIFGRAGWLWVSSIALLIAAAAFESADGTRSELPEERDESLGRLRDSPVELLVLAGLVALAFAARLWNLQGIPFAFDNDEFLAGRVATRTYPGAAGAPIFATAGEMADLPNLWFLLLSTSLRTFGTHLWALRLPAALFGAATVIPFYGFVRRAWGRVAAAAGSAFLAANACHIQYSRITVNNIVTPFFWAVCFFFLLRALKRRRPMDWALAGLAGGLSEYFFYGTRLLPFVLAVFLAYLLIVHRARARRELRGFLYLAFGYLIGFGPLLVQHLSHRGLYLGRGLSVLTWSHVPRDAADLQRIFTTAWPLLRENLLGFSTLGDSGPFYFAPLLAPAEAALLALGLALLLRHWRHPPSFLLLLSGFSVLAVVGTLLPGVRRIRDWAPAFPVFFAALAVPVEAWARSVSRQSSRALRRAAAVAAGLGVVALAGLDLDYYFHRYRIPRRFAELEIRAMQSRWQASLGSGYRVRTIGETWQPYDPEVNKYLVTDQEGAHLANPSTDLPLPGKEGKGLAFLFLKVSQRDYFALVRHLYPGGIAGELKASANGEPLFTTYVLAPNLAAAAYGVRLELLGRTGGVLWTGHVDAVGAIPPGAADAGDASRARWSGAVYLPESGRYGFDLGKPGAILRWDALPSAASEAVLQSDWHAFVVESDLAGPGAPRLRVKRDEGPLLAVTRDRLWPWPPSSGLLRAAASATETPVFRVDPFVGFSTLDSVLPPPGPATPPVRARWSGQLLAPRAGLHALEVRTDGDTRILIDGRTVLERCPAGGTEWATASTYLQAGWHAFQLDRGGSPRDSILELRWIPPNGARAFIPPEALRYATDGTIGRIAPPAGDSPFGCSSPR